LEKLATRCRGLTVVEIPADIGDPKTILTPTERSRLAQLGHRRRPSFLAARVALKRLAVQVGRAQSQTDPRELHSIARDRIRPKLPGDDGGQLLHCSVAHDKRYAVAVADPHPIGVDVELPSERVERVARVFVSQSEAALLSPATASHRADLTKIWTIKEAVTKGTGLPLAESFVAVQITGLGKGESRFRLADRDHTAYHDTLGEHIFTLVRFRTSP
jgi:phosphopantetheinyl transferase